MPGRIRKDLAGEHCRRGRGKAATQSGRMEDPYSQYRRKLNVGVPAPAIIREIIRNGLDPAQIPELGYSNANSTEDETSAAICGKQLLAKTLQGARPPPPRPRRWVVKTEAEL